MNLKNYFVPFIILAIGTFAFFLIGNFAIATIYLFIWVDKTFLGKLQLPGEFGLELTFLPSILSGILYGPAVGFLFSFLAIPVIGSLIDIVYARRSGFIDTKHEIFFPNLDTFINGMMAVLASFLKASLPFLLVAVVCIAIKNTINLIKGIMSGQTPIVKILINLGLNIGVAFYIQSFIPFILGT